MTPRQYARPVLPLLFALPLLLLGLVLHADWKGSVFPMPIIWACLSVLLLMAGCHAGVRDVLARLAQRHLGNPWLWLGIAVALMALGMVGVPHLGTRRYLGEVAMLRSGLWAMSAFVVFLALYAQQPSPGLKRHAVAALGSVAILLCLALQPDLFVIAVMGLLGLYIAWHARNALRWAGPVAVVGVFAALLLSFLTSPYRMRRFLAAFDAVQQDPLGLGWVAHVQARAQVLAGAFHGGGEAGARWLVKLPVDGPLYASAYAPAYITQWGGWAVLVGVGVLLLGMAGVLWWQVRAAGPAVKLVVRAGALALALTTLWAYAVYLFHWAFSDGFGLAFVSGEFGCLIALLALVAAVSTNAISSPENEKAES